MKPASGHAALGAAQHEEQATRQQQVELAGDDRIGYGCPVDHHQQAGDDGCDGEAPQSRSMRITCGASAMWPSAMMRSTALRIAASVVA